MWGMRVVATSVLVWRGERRSKLEDDGGIAALFQPGKRMSVGEVLRVGRRVVLAVAVGIAASASTDAEAFVPPPPLDQVPVINNPLLADIAAVFPTPQGPVIHLNGPLCARAGVNLCGFYMAHEYGHVALGHAFGTAWGAVAEASADCWAAKNASAFEFQAAYDFFSAGGGSTPVHGSGPQRAARIRACRASL